ncbi:MAG: hypothetical protein ACR2IQ_02730 [Minisyncoccia bacterium]
MKTIELTEQEVDNLKIILEAQRIDDSYDATTNLIINNIIKKLQDTDFEEPTGYPDSFTSEEQQKTNER